jgi:hypothetical protein
MFHYLYKFNRNKALLTNRILAHFGVLVIIAAIVAVVLGSSSCYTILKHPQVEQLEYENPMDVGCMSCHEEPMHPITRPPAPPPWWLDHEWGNELETVPIREGLRPAPGRIDDPPIKIPVDPPGIKVQPNNTIKTNQSKSKQQHEKPKARKIRPKQKKKKKENG